MFQYLYETLIWKLPISPNDIFQTEKIYIDQYNNFFLILESGIEIQFKIFQIKNNFIII